MSEAEPTFASLPALTLWQPWASLVVIGAKLFDTRSWEPPRSIIGQRIAIHAAARAPLTQFDGTALAAVGRAFRREDWANTLPRGHVVGTAVVAGGYRVASREGDTRLLLDASVPGSPPLGIAEADYFGE